MEFDFDIVDIDVVSLSVIYVEYEGFRVVIKVSFCLVIEFKFGNNYIKIVFCNCWFCFVFDVYF